MVGRKNEIERLEQAYNSKYAEFVGIYGRRRVGKTFLVTQTFANRFVFKHAGVSPLEEEETESKDSSSPEKIESSMKRQLARFHASLLLYGEKNPACPKSWNEAFLRMIQLIESKQAAGKKVVFLDELPWMDTPKSGFMASLEWFWNSWGCAQNDLMLIVAGSATSWMTNKLINNHGGLYGRLTREIRLEPLNLSECKELFQENGVRISDYDIAQAYMVFGGFPFYLKPMRPGQSFAQYVDECFFARNATFRREFDRLFGSVFVNPDTMKSIVRALYERRSGLTQKEIEKATGIKQGGRLGEYLENLIDSDFIVAYYPFGKSKRETYYRLVDPFCWFYLTFVDGANGLPSDFWLENTESPKIHAWRGLSFENLCFLHIPQIKRALGISGVRSEESAYIKRGDDKTSGAQIDLLIIRADNIADLCEAKFVSSSYRLDREEDRRLSNRVEAVSELLPKKVGVHRVLITTFGIAEHEYMWSYNNVITLDDLMK